MARGFFHIPGVILLLCSFVLLLLVSISLPYLPVFGVVRVHFEGGSATAQGQLSELRYGIWGYCWYEASGARTCSSAGHAYSTTVYNADKSSWQTVGPSWTRGLAVHPAAAGLTFFALLFSLSTHVFFTLLASLTSFLAALLTLIAFTIDIVLLAYVRRQMARLTGVNEHTDPGSAFWMTLVSFVLLCLAGSTVCVGRRRDRMASMNSKINVSWRDRFRRQA